MFPLSDRVRRALCRLGFIALCVLPTLGVAAWCIARGLPGQQRPWETLLSYQLGLDVTIDQVEYLSPRGTRLVGCQLRDGESGQAAGRFEAIELRDASDALWVTLVDGDLDLAALEEMWGGAERLLRRTTGPPSGRLRLLADRLKVRLAEGSVSLAELHGQFETQATYSHLYLSLRRADRRSGEEVLLRAVRNRETEPATTSLQLRAIDAALPTELFTPLVDSRDWLGPESTFRGQVWAVETPAGWEVEVAGDLNDVDLHRVVTRHFPHQLSGFADVSLERARLVDGRVLAAQGQMHAGPGSVSRSFILAASEALQLRWGSREMPGDQLPYKQLAFGFSLADGQIHLAGHCRVSDPPALLADHGPLLEEPSTSHPAAALVRALAPATTASVPASREAEWLLGVLPVPSARSDTVHR